MKARAVGRLERKASGGNCTRNGDETPGSLTLLSLRVAVHAALAVVYLPHHTDVAIKLKWNVRRIFRLSWICGTAWQGVASGFHFFASSASISARNSFPAYA
jgi:drug/metabolite transporter (DMT)-like permease